MIIAVFDECSRRMDIDGKLTQWIMDKCCRFVECRSRKSRFRYIFRTAVQNMH